MLFQSQFFYQGIRRQKHNERHLVTEVTDVTDMTHFKRVGIAF